MDIKNLKVALIHDFLDQYGGAERVLEVLCEMFPDAPIYTLLYDKEKMREKFEDREIFTSFLQKFPKFFRRRKKWLLPFMPTAPETFNLREFDLIISSSGAWSKGIVTRLNAIHISYLHSPMRFVWDASEEYLAQKENNRKIGFWVRLLLNYVRIWDKAASDRPDYLIANSQYTQKRIKKYYNRDSVVIYPPAIMEHGTWNMEQKNSISKTTNYELKTKSYFLVVSRLSVYKKIDVIIETFNKLELPLVIVGEGKDEKRLNKIAGKNIKFLGWQDESKLEKIYSNARAFIFAADDDFGIAPVEAMSFGIPVIALKKGGAKETVIKGETGEFFESATPEVIADTVRRFMEKDRLYDKEKIKRRASDFSQDRFKAEFKEYLSKILEQKS